jgi:exosortase/archaeosortase family protein
MVALAIGSLAAELRGSRLRGRLGWAAFAAALAILVNWVRVSTIVMLGHYTDMQHYIVRVSHYYYGWVLFAFALIVFFVIERRVALPAVTHERRDAGSSSAGAGRMATWFAIVAVIAALPYAMNTIIDSRPQAAFADEATPRGWSSSDTESVLWRPIQLNADRTRLRRFERSGQVVETFVAEYLDQRIGKKLGGSANRLEGAAEVLPVGTAAPATGWSEMVISQRGMKSLLWYQYRVAGERFSSATRAQAYYSWRTLASLQSLPSSVQALRADCADDCRGARKILTAFLAAEEEK